MDDNALIEKNLLLAREDVLWHCNAANAVALNYSNYLTTIGALILSLSPLLTSRNSEGVLPMGVGLKMLFITSLGFVFISLILGAVNAIKEKRFLQRWFTINLKIFNKWNEVHAEKTTIKEAENYCQGLKDGIKNFSASWPLLLQAVFVFTGLLGVIIIIIARG